MAKQPDTNVETGILVRVTWVDGLREATLEVQHENGDMTYMVVIVDRLTHRIPKPKVRHEPRF